MDIKFDEKARSFKQRTGEDYNGGFDISSNYQGSEGSGGYQHIGNTWPNTESQWNYDPSTNGYSTFLASTPDTSTTYQPYQPSEYANFSRQLESSSSSVPVYGGATDPTQTSTSSVISFGVAVHEPISESSASAYDDPTRNHWNPQSATSDYSTVPTSGTSNVFPSYQTSEYSSFPNQTPSSSSSYQQSSQYTPMVPDLINQAINGYTTPQYNQPNQQVNQDFNTNQFSASLASLHSQPLEASEDELLRQKRLMEIEQELHMINAKKMHMQMEAEIRHREMELAKRQQLMELRERELRDRECFENGRTHAGHTGQHNYDNREYSSHHESKNPSVGGNYSSTSRSISINEDPAASHYYGQRVERKKRLGGELARRQGRVYEEVSSPGPLKRSADQSRAGSIQPAEGPSRKQRRRNNKNVQVTVNMEDISDDEEV